MHSESVKETLEALPSREEFTKAATLGADALRRVVTNAPTKALALMASADVRWAIQNFMAILGTLGDNRKMLEERGERAILVKKEMLAAMETLLVSGLIPTIFNLAPEILGPALEDGSLQAAMDSAPSSSDGGSPNECHEG